MDMSVVDFLLISDELREHIAKAHVAFESSHYDELVPELEEVCRCIYELGICDREHS